MPVISACGSGEKEYFRGFHVKHQKKNCCFVLLAASIVSVFGQVHDFEFLNYDDNEYVTDNPRVANGPVCRQYPLGVHELSFKQLAPDHLDIPYGGLPNVRVTPRSPSPGKPGDPHRKRPPAVNRFQSDDRCLLEKRVYRRVVRPSPAACRIRCMDCRTQGPAQRPLLDAHHEGICQVCGTAPLPGDTASLCCFSCLGS